MTKLCKKAIEAAQAIGLFYLEKNKGNYAKTSDEITTLQFTDVSVDDEVVVITTKRPGLLIGKRGENVDKLQNYLGRKIRIIETAPNAVDFVVPYPEYEETYPDSSEFDRISNLMSYDNDDY